MIEPEQEFNQEYIPPVKKTLKIPIVPIAILIIVVLILIFISLSYSQKTPLVEITPTPEPETYFPRPTSNLQLPPSVLATDAAVLKTKSEVEENINAANTIDLSESNLTFPILDFNIGFQ